MDHSDDASNQAQTLELLTTLIGIDSVNPTLVPEAAGESAIVTHLQRRLQAAGFTTHIVHAGPDDTRPSLVAVPPGGPGERTVVLNGHLDTVGTDGMPDALTARVDGNRLLGRGAADMKGGVTAMVRAAERCAEASARIRPVVALVADEEDASIGSEAVTGALADLGIRPDVCLIGEPTHLALARSLRGFAVLDVHFPGRAAHSSEPENGVNAVTHLGRFLAALDARAGEIRSAGGDVMCTGVSGGSSAFVIPDAAWCRVERRTTAREGVVDVVAEVDGLLDPAWDATVTLVGERPAWQLDSEGSAADFAAALSAELGTSADFDAPYWMEAPLWQSVAPTLICGPSGGGLHAIDEWVDLEQVSALEEGLVAVCSKGFAAAEGTDGSEGTDGD